MKRREFLLATASLAGSGILPAADAFGQRRKLASAIAGTPVAAWAAKAEALKPVLTRTLQSPRRLVRAVADPALALRFRMEEEAPAAALQERVWHKGDSFILDFEGHRTGYLSFRLGTRGREPDAPARLRLVFGEVPTDVAEPLYPYSGTLSSAWLPDEIVNVDYLPRTVRMARRYAFRYVKVEVLDTSPGFGIVFEDVQAEAVSSSGPMPAPSPYAGLLGRIDDVAVATLRDCMQTAFEDGPRRDQRLWIGDLRLQALANYATFRRNELVKRCLYMFAAFPNRDGLVPACVYEQPQARYGGIHIEDYAVLFNVALADYVAATGDLATGRELWPVALRQLELVGARVNGAGLYADSGDAWIFIDWNAGLQRDAAMQGVLVYGYRRTLALARVLGRAADTRAYPARIARLSEAARKSYWDAAGGTVHSGPARQVSWASAAWLTLAQVLSKEEGAQALRTAMAMPDALKPVTPYLYHYVVEALLDAGLGLEARRLLESYWGAMVEAGADTFWEIFDPAKPLSSPYGDIHINSYCHAWSCTPSWLLRRPDFPS
jgi:alpha-L-rhamnosidase